MSTTLQFRALVVDDEALVRQATMRALARVGFRCEAAADGAAAWELIQGTRYDVVVTDLRMPDANGHQLAVDLLAMPGRPAVVILTGVMEPRLANDLKIRGVDEIFFKPVPYDVLAKQVTTIVERRAAEKSVENSKSTDGEPPNRLNADRGSTTAAQLPVAIQLAKAATKMRHAPTDFDGFSKASADAVRARDLGQAIEEDPSMRQEVLAFVNRALYGSHRALVELERSLAALQQRNALRAIIIFAVGAVVGLLLGWLTPALLM